MLNEVVAIDAGEEIAAQLAHMCAMDDFFENSGEEGTPYKFEDHKLEENHARHEVRVRLAMEAGTFAGCESSNLLARAHTCLVVSQNRKKHVASSHFLDGDSILQLAKMSSMICHISLRRPPGSLFIIEVIENNDTTMTCCLGIHPLYLCGLDCPNLQLWEMKPYLLLAEQLGYVTTVVEPTEININSVNLDFLAKINDTAARRALGKMCKRGILKPMLS